MFKGLRLCFILFTCLGILVLMCGCGSKDDVEDKASEYDSDLYAEEVLHSMPEVSLHSDNTIRKESLEQKSPHGEPLVDDIQELKSSESEIPKTEISTYANPYKFDIHSYEFETYGGYKIEGRINTSRWIKASDSSTLNEAWHSLNGSGDAPRIEDFNRKGSTLFRGDNSVMLFGSITFSNITESYDITPDIPLKIEPGPLLFECQSQHRLFK